MNEHPAAQSAADDRTRSGVAPRRGADDHHLDGNAAGGLLRELFAIDITAADAMCVGCGTASPVGALMAYGHRMGVVLRCPHCQSAVLRLTRTTRGYWLDLTGARVLRIFAAGGGSMPPLA